jgi:GT2 family glycosyltransferase
LLVAALFATGARERLPRRMAERLCLDGDWRHDRSRRVDWAYGAALLIPRDAVDAIGGFDESFFMYAEDVEWCWRAAGYGWSVWFEPSAVVTHVGNMSGAQAYGDERQALIIRNTQRLYRERRGALAAKVYRRLNARAADRAARKAQRHGDTGEATYWSRVRELHRSL